MHSAPRTAVSTGQSAAGEPLWAPVFRRLITLNNILPLGLKLAQGILFSTMVNTGTNSSTTSLAELQTHCSREEPIKEADTSGEKSQGILLVEKGF